MKSKTLANNSFNPQLLASLSGTTQRSVLWTLANTFLSSRRAWLCYKSQKGEVICKILSSLLLLSTFGLYGSFPTTDQTHHFLLIKADEIKTQRKQQRTTKPIYIELLQKQKIMQNTCFKSIICQSYPLIEAAVCWLMQEKTWVLLLQEWASERSLLSDSQTYLLSLQLKIQESSC